MSALNPHFRGADEIVVPSNLQDLCGWTDGKVSEQEAIDFEKRQADKLMQDLPVAFGDSSAPKPLPALEAKWNEFQKSRGRGEGSCDWTLLDEFVTGEPLVWLPQIIGSCVMSNTFPSLVARQMYQIALLGESREYLGREEFGPHNYACYGPFSYGMARRRANMRGSDGLYCEPMLESLMKDGQLSCATPRLIEILKQQGLADDRDYPEPQGSDGARLYRRFGNWEFLDELKQFADFRVLEGWYIKSLDDYIEKSKMGCTFFKCSMEAIHKVGTHPDGFAIHARNPRDRWAHNMGPRGFFYASDGELFVRESNESWGPNHIYSRRGSEFDAAIRTGQLTIAAIGQIDGPRSSPPAIA